MAMPSNEIVTVDAEEAKLHEEIKNTSEHIYKTITDPQYLLSILFVGAAQYGKSSLIQNIFGNETADNLKKMKIAIGNDGKPTTSNVTSYTLPSVGLKLIDTPGVERDRTVNRVRQVISEIRSKKLNPQIILIFFNYHASIEDAELEFAEKFPNIPVLLILNKVDYLQCYKTNLKDCPKDLEQFDQLDKSEFSECFLRNEKLISMRERLLDFRKSRPNIRRILITSMRSEADGDEPIGVEEVIAAVWGCLDNVGRVAFTSALVESKQSKIKRSITIVMTAVASVAGAAWIPIPVVDSIAITSIQIAMLLSLFQLWRVAGKGMLIDTKTFAVVFAKSMATSLGSFCIGYTLASLVKLIPGIGAISGGIAFTAIGTFATLFIGCAAILYLSSIVHDKVMLKHKEALEEHVKEFMKSERFHNFLIKMKQLAKTPQAINKDTIANAFS